VDLGRRPVRGARPLSLLHGDGENDRSLFSTASFSVATAEAVDSLKEAADFVCEGEGAAGVERFLFELMEGRETGTPRGGG